MYYKKYKKLKQNLFLIDKRCKQFCPVLNTCVKLLLHSKIFFYKTYS